MQLVRWHHARKTLATLLVVLLGAAPGPMMLLAASPPESTAGHHHSVPSAPHRHDLPTDCCSLFCSADCFAGGNIVKAEPLTFYTPDSARWASPAGRHGKIAYTNFSHRLPPPIGPPA
jgi:hypothetical protein